MKSFKEYLREDFRSDYVQYRNISILTKTKQLQTELSQQLSDGLELDLKEQLTAIISTANLKGRRIRFEDNMGVRVSIFRRDGESEFDVYADGGVESSNRSIPSHKLNQLPWIQSIKTLLSEYELILRTTTSTGIQFELNI